MSEEAVAPAGGSLTPERIIEALGKFDYRLPEAELAAAQAMPETMAPQLLRVLENTEIPARGALSEEDDWRVFYALFLLAAFRRGEALDILRRHTETNPLWLEAVLDESVTECGCKLFASMAAANPSALHYFIENRDLDEYIRGEAFEALVALTVQGALSLDALSGYLRRLACDVLRRGKGTDDSWLWHIFAFTVQLLDLREFHPLAKKAYAEGWIDPFLSTWDDDQKTVADPRIRDGYFEKYRSLVVDVADELRGWHCFTEAYREECLRDEKRRTDAYAETEASGIARLPFDPDESFAPRDTIVNDAPKIRPNQPCPCGSGKKYKKCCGRP